MMSKMLNSKVIVWLSLALVCFAGVAMAGTFTWTGDGGVDDDWTQCDNWSSVGYAAACFPSTTNDDALITGSTNESVVLVDIIEVIDDLTIGGEFTFDNGHATEEKVTVRVRRLEIVGGDSGATIEFVDGARITSPSFTF